MCPEADCLICRMESKTEEVMKKTKNKNRVAQQKRFGQESLLEHKTSSK